jgi:hypothetical protein
MDFLAHINTTLNRTAQILRTAAPLGGATALTAAGVLTGSLVLYQVAHLTISSLWLLSKIGTAAFGAFYCLEGRNVVDDCQTMTAALRNLIARPQEQALPTAHALYQFLSARYAFARRVLSGQVAIFQMPQDPVLFTKKAASLLISLMFFQVLVNNISLAVFSTLLTGGSMMALAALSLYALDLRAHPERWNEALEAFIAAPSVADKARLVAASTITFLNRKGRAIGAYLMRPHDNNQGAQQGAPAPERHAEVPQEFQVLARNASLLFQAVRAQFNGPRPAPGAR